MNQFVEYAEDVESVENTSIGNWIDHDQVGASHALGEDVISAIEEVLGYE
ncbi:hypothetical protein [Robertmurraya sp.]